ncbi:MAG: hypothetical protein DI549_08280 [Ancylobacter novellus]|uniref:Uncharacterized protein n=1 Tax=Ancylobacter novellus TaxID=921 RepID=A0A2W5R3G7_ANCNO|nr:MAG: hypothetical protein DI549_08280 [Ancylobacter novellus]
MFRTVVLSAIAALMGFTALFIGAASATGYFKRQPVVATVEIPVEPIAGDCVIQSKWMSDAGRMVKVERPVCY